MPAVLDLPGGVVALVVPSRRRWSYFSRAIIGNLTWNSNGSLKTLAITNPFNAGDAETYSGLCMDVSWPGSRT
jgi:hypothetical protein